jgi:hypothetical protein
VEEAEVERRQKPVLKVKPKIDRTAPLRVEVERSTGDSVRLGQSGRDGKFDRL